MYIILPKQNESMCSKQTQLICQILLGHGGMWIKTQQRWSVYKAAYEIYTYYILKLKVTIAKKRN